MTDRWDNTSFALFRDSNRDIYPAHMEVSSLAAFPGIFRSFLDQPVETLGTTQKQPHTSRFWNKARLCRLDFSRSALIEELLSG